jgi:protoporphyrinogen oxidase
MNCQTDILVVGAGITGCAAAQELNASGRDYLLIEKNAEPGGLTRSIDIGEAQFDYTGHFLHLSRYRSPENIPYAHQKNSEWQLIDRYSAVYTERTVVPAPFQYNLFALPKNVRDQYYTDYLERTPDNHPASFKDYLLAGFGRGICEAFLFPYNEKLMATPLQDLSVENVKRFFPLPDKQMIESGYAGKGEGASTGYNSCFWYPIRNGIGVLAKGLAEGLTSLKKCCPLESIDLEAKVARTPFGTIKYDKVITSIPLNVFCRKSSERTLHHLAARLNHTRVLCINILLKGEFKKEFRGCHWIYVPDRDLPFYRVGIYSHLPNSVYRKDRTALYVERAYSGKETESPSIDSEIQEALSSLERLGWVYRRDCITVSANWIDCAYVHFDHARRETVEEIKEILNRFDVHTVGRYGLWDYISMEDSIYSGLEAARKVRK